MTNHSSRLSLVILAITLVIVFYRLWFGDVFFWGLPALQFYPWREYAFEMLRAGQLPLWNLYDGAGTPLLANYQSALLYPLNWFGFVLPLAWQMSVVAVLHLFIAGWGMWAFTGRLGITPLGRGLSALAFAMTSYLVARLGTYPTISTAAWIPWILWAALGILTRFRRRDVAYLALFSALQLLGGHAQTTWYGMLLVGMFSAWWVVSNRPIRWSRLGVVIAGLMLGAGVAAVQLIPTAELLSQSQRSGGVDYDFAMNFSYGLPRTLNFLSPNVFGNPGDGSYVTKGAFFEDAVYIGLLPLISAFAAILSWGWGKLWRTERPKYFVTVPFWLLVVIVGFLFALGENSPIFPFLYRNVPSFDLFQAPVRWHIWTVFGLSVLAGIGVGAWGHGYWLFFGTRLATAACIGAVLLALLAPRFLPPDVSGNDGVQVIIQAVIVTGILGAMAGVLTLTQPETTTHRWYVLWTVVVLVVVAVDLGYAAQGLNPTMLASFYDRRISPDRADVRAYWPKEANETVKYETYLPFDDYRVAVDKSDEFRNSGLDNLNLLDRVGLLNNFDPLLIGHFDQYIDLIEANPAQRDILLQAAGVSAIYDANGELIPLERPAARAWVVESACWHPNEASMIDAMLQSGWNPLRQVQLLGEGDCPALIPESDTPGEVVGLSSSGNSQDIQVNVRHSSWLVIADTDYPGWYASDGDSLIYEKYRANLAFQAIPISHQSGASQEAVTVHLGYEPRWLWIAPLVSLVSLLVMIVLFRSKSPSSKP